MFLQLVAATSSAQVSANVSMNKLFTALLALTLLATACSGLPGAGRATGRPATVTAPAGSDLRLTGLVHENHHGCEIDIHCMLEVDVGGGVLFVIYHYGEGERRCDNSSVFERAWSLERGDRVEVFAEVIGSSTLSVCDALRYNIRKLP